ncbi:hypothetical protein Ahy_B04g072719 [Arachis hypogaea]|uniref:Uncharacterized protein n=1 Tax=Arachis hypogaea TaxID=3818 RepID=A0A444ZNT0_ARAHY|nr:hypothetical protein Ahy_B04g072719 [Arachis hypogaea]
MADEISNTNVVSSINDNVPIVALTSAELTSHMEGSILEENATINNPLVGNNWRNPCPRIALIQTQLPVTSGSTSNGPGVIAAFRQHVGESSHNLVNLLTRQMTTILNPMMADHETKFERLTRQVKQIARIVDYDEGDQQNGEVNLENLENMLRDRNGDIRLGEDIP